MEFILFQLVKNIWCVRNQSFRSRQWLISADIRSMNESQNPLKFKVNAQQNDLKSLKVQPFKAITKLHQQINQYRGFDIIITQLEWNV
jgi:uncharacterized protein YlxW (UPF0749 family)